MKLSNKLRKAQKLIEDPTHWGIGAPAFDKSRKVVLVRDRKAFAFCAVGACMRVTHYDRDEKSQKNYIEMVKALSAAAEDTPMKGLSVFTINDTCGHDEVMALYDAAIARAKLAELAKRRL